MSYTLPRSPYSTAQQPEDPGSGQPPMQPITGQPSLQDPSVVGYSQYGPSGMPPVNANGGYGSNVTAWQLNALPWSQNPVPPVGPNPAPSPRPGPSPTGGGPTPSPTPPAWTPPSAGQPPSATPGTRNDPSQYDGGTTPDQGAARHPVDLFNQMVAHPHGQAILQSQGWTPPQQQPASYGTQPRATPAVPNPGFPTQR